MKIRICNRCNEAILKERKLGYPYYCPECFENYYDFETKIIDTKMFDALKLKIKAIILAIKETISWIF